jgi:hypothetical protein
VILLGTGVGFLLIIPSLWVAAEVLRMPWSGTLLLTILPQNDGWKFVIFLGLVWVTGIAVTYLLVGWAIQSIPRQ